MTVLGNIVSVLCQMILELFSKLITQLNDQDSVV